MSLDITAYNNLRLVPDHNRAASGEWCQDGDHITAFAYKPFVRSMDGLAGQDQTFGSRSYSDVEFIGGFCYEITPATVTGLRNYGSWSYPGVDVMHMSYGGYNRWREALTVTMTGLTPREIWAHPTAGECPFYDLINFADNEGTIGPKAAARLHADFTTKAFRDKFEAACPDEVREWWMQAWDGWVEGTRVAMQDGLVKFH